MNNPFARFEMGGMVKVPASCVVAAALLLWGARVLGARAEQTIAGAVTELPFRSEVTGLSTMVVNGQTFRLTARDVTGSTTAVADVMASACEGSLERLSGLLSSLPTLLPAIGESATPQTLLCLRGNETTLVSRLWRFARTMDLGALGDITVVTARPGPNEGTTEVLIIEHEGPLPLEQMLPRQRDAAGSDSREVPRVRDSRRTLSIQWLGASQEYRAYVVPRPKDAVLSEVAQGLSARGYTERTRTGSTLTFVKGSRAVLVTCRAERGETRLQVLELGNGLAAQSGVHHG